VMRKVDIAIPPLLLAFVLTNIMEPSLRRALVQSDGNFLAFFERPIAAVFLILTAIVVVSISYVELRKFARRSAVSGGT